MDDIIIHPKKFSDYGKDFNALNVADVLYVTRPGNQVPQKMTKGWKLLVEWVECVDGSMDWVRFAEINDAYP